MSRDKMILRRGDEFNPEGRCGEPLKRGGKRYVHVWFTYESFKSYATDKIMDALMAAKVVTKRRSNETVLYERVRYIYYSDGRFYRPNSQRSSDRKGDAYGLVPYDGTIYTCYPEYQARFGLPDCEIVCVDGWPVSLKIDNEEFVVDKYSWPSMEAYLGLDEQYKPERYRPKNDGRAA